MIGGFLGTLICLERAVALGRAWGYSAPLFAGVGGILVIFGLSTPGAAATLVAATVLVAIFVQFLKRQSYFAMWVMALAVVLWWAGVLFWLLGRPLFEVSFWWAGFLVLTIAGERLELGRFIKLPRRALFLFVACVVLTLVALAIMKWQPIAAARVYGAGLIALCLWLYRYDIARRSMKRTGLPRFTASCLLHGYIWLAVSGILLIRYGQLFAGPIYDAVLHGVFVGFTFSMILGHAPIVFPVILGKKMEYHRFLYAPLYVLHGSLVLRVVGDLLPQMTLRQWGSILNVVAILLFVVANVVSVRLGARQTASQ
jgi:hypothetical protein